MRWHGANTGAALIAAALMVAPAAAVGQDDLLAGVDAVQSEGLGSVNAGVQEGGKQPVDGAFKAIEIVAEEKKDDLGDGYDPMLSALNQAQGSLAYGLARLEAGLGQAGGSLNNASGGLPQGPLASSVNPISSFGRGF